MASLQRGSSLSAGSQQGCAAVPDMPVGTIVEIFSNNANGWLPGRVSRAEHPGRLTILFTLDGDAAVKHLTPHSERLRVISQDQSGLASGIVDQSGDECPSDEDQSSLASEFLDQGGAECPREEELDPGFEVDAQSHDPALEAERRRSQRSGLGPSMAEKLHRWKVREMENLPPGLVGDEELDFMWRGHATYHALGIGCEDDYRRCSIFSPVGIDAGVLPVRFSSAKGQKGSGSANANQDNFSLTYLSDGYAMVCCCDGHGAHGNAIATRVARRLPCFLAQSLSNCKTPESINMPETLAYVFDKAQEELVIASTLESGWDSDRSGTTALCVVWNASTLWTAYVGDSRCVMGCEGQSRVYFQTVDHKPSAPKERTRIQASGGEVRRETCDDGEVIHRVYVKGGIAPGLAMSRAFGDGLAQTVGVNARPDIGTHVIPLSEMPFLVLASDGIWDVMDSDLVVQMVNEQLPTLGAQKTVDALVAQAKLGWEKLGPYYMDDITAIILCLGQGGNFPGSDV